MKTDPELERRIGERARDFDVSALRRLLRELGYPDDLISRTGHPASAPQPAWLDSVSFGEGIADVTIHANLGLMSCRTPLPAYFRQLAEDPDVREPLEELLSLLDDRLLERRFASYEPERDSSIVPDWTGAKRDLLSLTALRSTSGLHWLFTKVYPELRVTVRRAPQDRWMDAPQVHLGSAQLGAAALCGEARLPVRGLEVTLLCDDRLSSIVRPGPDGSDEIVPWGELAMQRLRDLVFPALRETGAHLSVVLIVLDRGALARLRGTSEEDRSYLGYDPMKPRRRIRFRSIRVRRPRRRIRARGRARVVLRRCVARATRMQPLPARIVLFSGAIPTADAASSS